MLQSHCLTEVLDGRAERMDELLRRESDYGLQVLNS